MRTSLFLSLISSSLGVLGHGHSHDGPADGETVQEYAQRHVRPLWFVNVGRLH